jgi:hypothetical protein
MNAAPLSRPLPVPECLRLLTTALLGRIVYTRNALPAVEPVRFTLEGGHIFAAVGPASALPATVDQSVVAFQADRFDDHRDAWSVTVVGGLRLVNDPAEIAKLRGQGLMSWMPSERDQFMHITPGLVTGQRLFSLRGRGGIGGRHTPEEFGTGAVRARLQLELAAQLLGPGLHVVQPAAAAPRGDADTVVDDP